MLHFEKAAFIKDSSAAVSDRCGDSRSDIEERLWVLFGLIYGGTKELDNYPNEIINDDVQQQTGNPLAQLERLFGDTKLVQRLLQCTEPDESLF